MMGMMNDDKKKMATLILGFGKKGESPESPKEESGDKETQGNDYAGEVMKALKDGDKTAFKGALKAFIYECMNKDEQENEEDYG